MPEYPSGQLRTSTTHLSNLIRMFQNKGIYKDHTLLKSTTVDSMLTPYVKDSDKNYFFGFGIFTANYMGHQFWGHTGSWYGVWNAYLFVPEENWGVVLSTNTGLQGNLPCQGKDIIDDEVIKYAEVLVTSIHNDQKLPIVQVYQLSQNYPNPFNPSTTINFQIPKSKFTTLKVYNILGKEVATLVSNKLNQGNHTYQFDGKNLASGIYYYQLVAGEFREVKKMILLR
jgi:hypothetical protein